MDDERDDFEEKMEEDEIDALDEEDLMLGLGEEEDEKEESEDDLLKRHNFHRDDEDEDPLSDF